jgi:hypothetical protein
MTLVAERAARVGPASPHILETDVNGDTSLYNPRTEQVTILNGTASDIWRLADGSHTLDEMTELLASAYRTSPEQIAGDVEAAVSDFVKAGLLVAP